MTSRRVASFTARAEWIAVLALGILGATPETAQTTFEAGLAAEEKGDLSAAKAAYEQSLSLVPEYGLAMIHHGLLEIRQKRVSAGMKLCQKAADADPNAAKAHYCLGLGNGKSGKDAEAAAGFERAIALKKDDP